MALIPDKLLPLIADPRIIRSNKVTLKFEDFAVCPRLQRLIVELHIPYARGGVLTESSFRLVHVELLACTVSTEKSSKVMRLNSLVLEETDDLVSSHRDRRHQAFGSGFSAVLTANEDSGARS